LQEQDIPAQPTKDDPHAFRLIYDRFAQSIYDLCFRYLRDQAEAQDAVQEVFIRAYQSLDQFHGRAKLSTWLYRIAVNYCLNQKRRKNWQSWLTLEFLDQQQIASEEIANNPQHQMEKKETDRLIQQAIEALPERQKMAIILSRYENLSYQEIAEAMNCSLSAVESCIHHAKKNLACSLKKLLKK
jgi:RNA polymerase sigma-70 factor, ECF subfamily